MQSSVVSRFYFNIGSLRSEYLHCPSAYSFGANEVLGCPGQNFPTLTAKKFNSSPKISDDFLVIYPKFSPFVPTFNIHTITGPLDAPQSRKHFFTTFFLTIYIQFFFTKLGFWMPPGWMPGAVATSARHCARTHTHTQYVCM